MRSYITMAAVASLLLAAGEPNPGPEDATPIPGWSFVTEGSGIPRDQDAGGFATGVDREVAHGGHASVSIHSIVAEPKHFRAVTQLMKADAYRGKRVRLAGYLKTRDVRGGWAGLWLRVDGPDAKLIAVDNMAAQRVMGTTDWSRHAVVLDVSEAAVRLAYGALLHVTGQVWADDLTLEVVDPRVVPVTSQGVEPITHAEWASNLDFEATGPRATDVIPGWRIPRFNSGSFSRRIVEGGVHGGRAFLEITSAPEARSSGFVIVQDLAAGPYRGKRVRFRAYLKTKGVADPAYLWLRSDSDTGMRFVSTKGRGPKGTTDWGPQEVALDVAADAGGQSFGVVAPRTGTFGVDDASLEVVDPAEVPATEGVTVRPLDPAKRARELKEALPRTPDRPENLDFER
jgi:hypothetical protein